jgi:hypothetical protein
MFARSRWVRRPLTGLSALLFGAALVLMISAGPARADKGPGGGGGGGSGGSGGGLLPGLRKIEGRLTGINPAAGVVVITTFRGQPFVLRIVPGTKVERNDRHVSLFAFRIGDRAQAIFRPNGVAVKFEAVGP